MPKPPRESGLLPGGSLGVSADSGPSLFKGGGAPACPTPRLSRRALSLGLLSAGIGACHAERPKRPIGSGGGVARADSGRLDQQRRTLVVEPPASAKPGASSVPQGNDFGAAAPRYGLTALAAIEPGLRGLPWCELLSGPSPVREVPRGKDLGFGSLWLKDDATCAERFGGSKPRKLEALLGAARAAGARQVVTFGALGSNHVTATAVHAQRYAMGVRAYVLPAPLDERGKLNLEICRAANAELVKQPSQRAAERAASLWLGQRPSALVLPWGGTSAVGNLGLVAACAELADQVQRGELPAPKYVFVAAGTLGTAAGLAIGLAMTGLGAQLVPVRASNRAPYTQRRFEQEIARTIALIKRYSADTKWHDLPAAPRIDDSELGAGYAVPSQRGRQAAAWLRSAAHVELDLTYTAKAFAALLGAARGQRRGGPPLVQRGKAPLDLRDQHVLFWQTSHSLSAAG